MRRRPGAPPLGSAVGERAPGGQAPRRGPFPSGPQGWLAARRGDCNEHGRAARRGSPGGGGIPARVVGRGRSNLDGAFYYHAWTELWLGTWVSARRRLSAQLPTDATHVKAARGAGPERHNGAGPAIVGELRFTAEESQR